MAKQTNIEKDELKPIAGVSRLPEVKELPFDFDPKTDDKVYDNLPDFEFAIGNAPLEDIEYVEVTQKLFDHITRKQPNRYVTYKGVKVYVKGTKEQNDNIDKMTAEQYYNHTAQEAANRLK